MQRNCRQKRENQKDDLVTGVGVNMKGGKGVVGSNKCKTISKMDNSKYCSYIIEFITEFPLLTLNFLNPNNFPDGTLHRRQGTQEGEILQVQKERCLQNNKNTIRQTLFPKREKHLL